MLQSIDQACFPLVCSLGFELVLAKPLLKPTQKVTPHLAWNSLGKPHTTPPTSPTYPTHPSPLPILSCDIKAWSHTPLQLCYLLLGIFFIEFVFLRLKAKQWEQII